MNLNELLNGGLPLEKVGPHLRHAARRALRSGEHDRMLIVAKVIAGELLRRGDLVRVAVAGNQETAPHYCLIRGTHRLLDLSALGHDTREIMLSGTADTPPDEPVAPEKVPEQEEAALPLDGIDSVLVAMEDAQKLDFSDPKSGEPGVILDSILTLLTKFTPQFQLHIMLFEETPLRETRSRVFIRDDSLDRLDWLQAREPGHSVWIPRASQLPRQLRKGEPDEKGHESSVVAVPLYDPSAAERNLVDRAEVGLLFLVTRQSWERDTLLRLASRLSRFVTHRWQQHSDVNKRIYVDALTGLFNRGYFDGQLALLVERARRNEAPLSLIIVDIDHFKSINDEFGHLVGDRVLKMVARRLQEELRRIDLVCRIGGEEIALVLPDADQDAAQEVTQRLLNSTFSERVTVDGQQIEVAVTFSFGGVTYPYAGSDSFQLYKQADALMYLSKDRGRNQCHFWSNDGNHLRLVPSTTQT